MIHAMLYVILLILIFFFDTLYEIVIKVDTFNFFLKFEFLICQTSVNYSIIICLVLIIRFLYHIFPNFFFFLLKVDFFFIPNI